MSEVWMVVGLFTGLVLVLIGFSSNPQYNPIALKQRSQFLSSREDGDEAGPSPLRENCMTWTIFPEHCPQILKNGVRDFPRRKMTPPLMLRLLYHRAQPRCPC